MATQQQVQRKQKFLVDVELFDRAKPSSHKHVQQCYLAVEVAGGFEVRAEHVRSYAVNGDLLDAVWTQTYVRRELTFEYGLDAELFDRLYLTSMWKCEFVEYDVDGWTVDVFTSGPLQGVAVAEMGLSAEYADVAAFLTTTGQQWPTWLAGTFCRCDDAAEHGSPVDLTHVDVNLVAAGVKPMSPRLRFALDDLAASREARKLSAYASAPRNRQGVVDLDKAAQRARQQAKVGSFTLLGLQRDVKASS